MNKTGWLKNHESKKASHPSSGDATRNYFSPQPNDHVRRDFYQLSSKKVCDKTNAWESRETLPVL